MPITMSGTLSLLRVHDVGTAYGPPNDQIDVEVVVQFQGRPADAFGFQLRTDGNEAARRGMLDLLRDGFNYGHTVNLDFEAPPGHHNGVVIRVWLTHPVRVVAPIGGTRAAEVPR